MAEKITLGDSYYREVEVTRTDSEGEKEPYSLVDYNDNFVAIKDSRELPDEEAFIFKRVHFKGNPADGTLVINLSPEETSLLPDTSKGEVEKLLMFVQVGSSITGRIHEVAVLKAKTLMGGIHRRTLIDKGYDMGCLEETIGWEYDAGNLCDMPTMEIDFGLELDEVFFSGGYLTDDGYDYVLDLGDLEDTVFDIYDLGSAQECTVMKNCN